MHPDRKACFQQIRVPNVSISPTNPKKANPTKTWQKGCHFHTIMYCSGIGSIAHFCHRP